MAVSIIRAIRRYRQFMDLAADIASLEASRETRWLVENNPREVLSLLGDRCRRLLK